MQTLSEKSPKVRARCEACDKRYRVPSADRTYVCQVCGGTVSVPEAEHEQPEHHEDEHHETLQQVATHNLRKAYKWIDGVTWLFRLGALGYVGATLASVLALSQTTVPVTDGLIVVVLMTAMAVLMLMGARLILFHPIAWTVAIASLATVAAVVHLIGPDPLGVAFIASTVLAAIAWAALIPVRRFGQLMDKHQDLYILHHASSVTLRVLKGRAVQDRHERLLGVMHRAAKRALKVSAVGATLIVLASALGTTGVLMRMRPQEYTEPVASFEEAWNRGDLTAACEHLDEGQRDAQRAWIQGALAGHGFAGELPQLRDPEIERDGPRVSLSYFIGDIVATAYWASDGRLWHLVKIELPDPPLQPELDVFLEAWRSSNSAGIVSFYSPENRGQFLSTFEKAVQRRNWNELPEILGVDVGEHVERQTLVTLTVADGEVLTKWHLRKDASWGLHGIVFPKIEK